MTFSPTIHLNGSMMRSRKEPSSSRYARLVAKAKTLGFEPKQIMDELQKEKEWIIDDNRHANDADPMMKSMARNVKVSCLAAIQLEMDLLRKEIPEEEGEIK